MNPVPGTSIKVSKVVKNSRSNENNPVGLLDNSVYPECGNRTC